MPKTDRNPQRENKSRSNEPNFNWRGIILLAIGFGCIAIAMLYFRGGMQPLEDVPYNRFIELLENKQIVTTKIIRSLLSSKMAERRKPCAALTFAREQAQRRPSPFRFGPRSI